MVMFISPKITHFEKITKKNCHFSFELSYKKNQNSKDYFHVDFLTEYIHSDVATSRFCKFLLISEFHVIQG